MKRRSFILIAVYGVIVVLLVWGSSLLLKVGSEKRLADIQKYNLQALYLAEAGLDRGLVWLRDQSSYPAGTAPILPSSLQNIDLETGEVSVTIDPYDTNPTSYLKRYKIIATATVEGVEKILNLDVVTDNFARYAYFTDDEHYKWGWWRIPVWFVGWDHIQGPLHTNSHLHISDNPVFDGMVRTGDDYITYYHGGPPQDNPQFNGGLQLGVDTIHMPSKALDLRTAAVQNGLHLETDTTIVLKDDGTMDVTNAKEGWVNKNMPLPSNGAIFVTGGNVYISGTLRGQLTVGTNKDIVITGSIVYADDPRLNPDSKDMLGLIAERDIIVSKDAPYDVEIDASLMALGDSFMVEEWWEGPPKGTLTVLGGIIQKERGPVGTFSGSTGKKLSGYSKNYIYDGRLINQNPPYYPTTGDYIVLLWKKNT